VIWVLMIAAAAKIAGLIGAALVIIVGLGIHWALRPDPVSTEPDPGQQSTASGG
jgi:hypothetical protein